MTLKTLKGMVRDKEICKGCAYTLRQEAIKWYHRSDDNKHTFIKEFFNITENDLQEVQE